MAQKNVLVVDDLAELGRMLQAALGTLSEKLVVRVVPSAEEGLLEATRSPVDLMIIDVRLPGMGGLELTRRVRQRQKDVKVIQISGMDDLSLQQQAMEAGANLFFRKPLAMTEFLSAVERMLDLKKTAPIVTQPASEPAAEYPNRLKEQISQLRQVLSAPTVLLLDDLGNSLVQDGVLDQTLTSSGALSALVSALEAGAKVSLSLGPGENEMVASFRGQAWDLMAAPLSASLVLVVVFKHGPSRVATAIAFDEITKTRLNILGLMRDKGSPSIARKKSTRTGALAVPLGQAQVEPPASTPVASAQTEEEDLNMSGPVTIPDAAVDPKLAADLDKRGQSQPKKIGDLDAFWEEAAEKQPAPKGSGRSGVLSYEQAHKMGLAPDADGPDSKKK